MFTYFIIVKPLGLLYGSAGRFLSPENLVGRSGTSFPPSAATLSGVFAAHYKGDRSILDELCLAGPFWAWDEQKRNFYVPTPFNCLVKDGKIKHLLYWHEDKKKWLLPDGGNTPHEKFESGTWIAIKDWTNLNSKPEVTKPPWEFLPHLHPQLKEDERRVDFTEDAEAKSLFLENSVQLHPEACLVYLSNLALPSGCYRFGGEGHIVDIHSQKIKGPAKSLLTENIDRSFATITPAIWGSNRLSYRAPIKGKDDSYQFVWFKGRTSQDILPILTERPLPLRHRLGNSKNQGKNDPKMLSRGRYAVPPGTVYIADEALNKPWHAWEEKLFPKEGYCYKRWGFGLSLPLVMSGQKA